MIQQYLKMYKDNQKQQLKDYFENILKEKYLNQVPNPQNVKSQNQKPLNMNFAELINKPQMATAQNEQFNTPIAALKDPSLNLNYEKHFEMH